MDPETILELLLQMLQGGPPTAEAATPETKTMKNPELMRKLFLRRYAPASADATSVATRSAADVGPVDRAIGTVRSPIEEMLTAEEVRRNMETLDQLTSMLYSQGGNTMQLPGPQADSLAQIWGALMERMGAPR